MAIRYRLAETRHPQTGERRYKARPVVVAPISTETLIEMISKRSSVSAGDISSVLTDLNQILAEELVQGRSVELGPLGRVDVRLVGESMKSPEEFHPAEHLKGARIRFRAGRKVRRALEGASFEMLHGVPGRPEAEEGPETADPDAA